MEEADKDRMTIRMVGGECFFWYRLTRIVPDKGRKTVVVVVVVVVVSATTTQRQSKSKN